MTYQELLDTLGSYQLALTTMNYDAFTIAPKDGSDYRNKSMAILAGEYFKILTSEATYQTLEAAAKDDDAFIAANASDTLKKLRKVRNIPQDEYVAFQSLKNDAYSAWEKARNAKDYSIFEPYLQKLVETQKRLVSYRDDQLDPYDSCLDNYEEGLRIEHVETFFEKLTELVPFIDEVIAAQPEKPEWTAAFVDAKTQADIAELIMDHLGYTQAFGHLGIAEHPFSSTFSIHDTRITTHYYEHNFLSSIFSIIHEVGHSMYNHQVNPKFEGYPFADNMSFSMHESQSRFLENIVGRSEAFWAPLYPKLQAIIPEVLSDVSLSDFVKAINYVEKSPIRTEADELTYSLHILLRYNVEKDLFTRNIDTGALDQEFSRNMEELLGITPESDRDGILQDIHWSDASFGYFPTYALGSAYAAQFEHTMRKSLDLDAVLKAGDFATLFAWLKENIHQYSGSISTQELIVKVTGEPFNPDYYIGYLKGKYQKLLGI